MNYLFSLALVSIFYVHVIKLHLFELIEGQTAQTTGVYRSSIVLFTKRTISKISLYYLRLFYFYNRSSDKKTQSVSFN